MSTFDPGAGAGTPAASPAAPGTSGSAASQAGDGVAASSAAPVQQPVELLRREYEATKSKLEPWEKLGAKPEEVQRSHQTYTKLFTESTTLGQQLGYDAAEIQQAFESDPAATLAFLRREAQKASGAEQPLTPQQIQKLIDQRTSEKLKPFQQEREQRLDAEAETRFNGEFDRQLKTSFPKGLPDSNKEALSGLAWSILTDNKDGFAALRGKGDITSVAAAFEQAKKTFLKVLTDYGEHEKKRIVGDPPPEVPGNGGAKKPQTLDDMISRLGDRSIADDAVFTGR